MLNYIDPDNWVDPTHSPIAWNGRRVSPEVPGTFRENRASNFPEPWNAESLVGLGGRADLVPFLFRFKAQETRTALTLGSALC